MNDWKECIDCGDDVHVERWQLGYHWCKFCGEDRARTERASWCIAPMNKSNYMYISDLTQLKQLNPKRTT